MTEAIKPPLRPPPGKRASVALAVTVHLILAAILVYGIQWQTHLPTSVSVELVSAVPPAPTFVPKPPPEPVKKVEPKPEPKPVPPPPKPDIAVKEKEKPKPPPPKPVPPPPKEVPPQADPFAEQLKRETEQLARKRETDAAAAELDKLKADQAHVAQNRAVADYLGKIRGKIRGNIVLPPDVKGNPEAIFDVTQLPSGEILGVRLRKSSGHAALDGAIERAILKSSPLPKPDRPDLFSRSLELRFRPLDN
ncbi:MAG: TonB C-terminal domain-containing protein [Gammaproteobacteria bacterium]|nr:TonB C-terminal domain-containing protein [Gammaproteobacteria bacterium]MBU1645082.1 TonB C-terminal domain-containing protein [Gammaproteobacteria bacterium]MBU1973319.1 TonB C-terminal domain-containing protein [Gammaproteobacteria bacterium]